MQVRAHQGPQLLQPVMVVPHLAGDSDLSQLFGSPDPAVSADDAVFPLGLSGGHDDIF